MGERICKRSNSAYTKVSEEEGGDAPIAGSEIPLHSMEVNAGPAAHWNWWICLNKAMSF